MKKRSTAKRSSKSASTGQSMCPALKSLDHSEDKELGTTETYKQTLDGEEFFVHCYRDDKYVCKMMSCHGLLDKVADHKTARRVNGAWKSFHYAEPFSRHNRSKHWVDDHNNRRHDPISLDDTWKTKKQWPMRQFTFTLAVAEEALIEPQLDFRKKLAKLMLQNTLGEDTEPAGMSLRGRASLNGDIHRLVKRQKYEGAWDNTTQSFAKTKQRYQKSNCA
ncbi:hypothetical protein ACHAWO_003842 [Cyclotella atomus]|uniref:Uncharacterized protein n=1 Tax=Cyclotella atomus TaxID=382360 RepID=A0ABD3QRL2_9STRA